MKYRVVTLLFLYLTLFEYSSCTLRRHRESGNNNSNRRFDKSISSQNSRSKSVVKMKNQNGVYYVPCKINGSEMQFIFDTGASEITMSAVEAMYLYKQGMLDDDDILGTQQYQIADGSISEGTVVNLKTVTIGNRTLNNIRASIVHNLDAPLLLGQSALSKFGKISIDYKNNTIYFE